MALTVGQNETPRGPYILAPKGYHPSTLVGIKDMGLIETEFKGQKKTQHKALFTWELDGNLMEDGRPYSISQRYTLSAYENGKLRQHVSSWLNKSFSEEEFKKFDLETLIKSRCQLFIEHRVKDGKTFANVVSIGEAPQVNFEALSKKLEACWTHQGIDVIKGEAISARQQQLITSAELNQLAEKSRARRLEIDNPAKTEELPQF